MLRYGKGMISGTSFPHAIFSSKYVSLPKVVPLRQGLVLPDKEEVVLFCPPYGAANK